MFIAGSNSGLLLGFQYWQEATPTLLPVVPLNHARDVAIDSGVEFDLSNAASVTDLSITIGGDVAYANGQVQPGWTGSVSLGATLHAELRRQRPFSRNEHVAVQVSWTTGIGLYSFDTLADEDCWHGALTAFESLLGQTLPLPQVDLLRTRVLYAATTTKEINASVRAVVQMAFETEIKVVLQRLTVIANEVFTSRVCERRRFIEIDSELKSFRFVIEAALAELQDSGRIPLPYLQLYQRYIYSKQPRYRVCGLAALVCLVAYYYSGAAA